MTIAVADALEWMATQLMPIGTAAAVYRRGATTINLTYCVDGMTERERADEEGGVLKIRHHDFIIQASEISSLGNPTAGDLVEIADRQGGTAKYEVLPLGDEPCFRRVHEAGPLLRIHTALKVIE